VKAAHPSLSRIRNRLSGSVGGVVIDAAVTTSAKRLRLTGDGPGS
jgi:hypothetical protein